MKAYNHRLYTYKLVVEVTFSFIEKKDRYGTKYYDVDDTEYHITCTNCSQIVAVTKKSILNNK